MTIVVTGATGHLGRLAVEALLERNVPADQIVATGRDLTKIADLGERGVRLAQADFTDPQSLEQAFTGADRILLVSSSAVGQRVEQHSNAIDAARAAGVDLLVYTSFPDADHTSMLLAADHIATEKLLADSGVPHTIVRNSWYLEIYTEQLPTYLEHGVVLGSAGNGRISAATRADYAAAAAVVLLGEDHAGKIYELGGDEAFTLSELAETVTEVTGQPVTYQDLPADEYAEALVRMGLPADFAAVLADSDLGASHGGLFVDSGDLSRLIGRPTTTLRAAIEAAVR